MRHCRSWCKGAGATTLIAMLVGCSSVQDHEKEIALDSGDILSFLADKPEGAHHMYLSALKQGERNLVLNHTRAGAAAMELGAYETAERSFDLALSGIETIYADNPKAQEARSNFTKENLKDFKGEPYERAMAYYYRGLLYLQQGDYENARASFKGGMLQDSMAADETYLQDFSSLAFLEAWSSYCNGDSALAEEGFREALKLDPSLRKPASGANLLLISELGVGPTKYAEGEHDELLKFAKGPYVPERSAVFTVGGRDTRLIEAEDLFWQATTRGGRQVDHVLAGKAAFKDNMDLAGNILAEAGYQTALIGSHNNSSAATIAGGVIALIGIAAKAAAAATTPDADTRYWDNLPAAVHLAAVQVPSVPETARVRFLNGAGQPITELGQTVPIDRHGECGIAWARSRSATKFPDRAPNSSVEAIADASFVPPSPANGRHPRHFATVAEQNRLGPVPARQTAIETKPAPPPDAPIIAVAAAPAPADTSRDAPSRDTASVTETPVAALTAESPTQSPAKTIDAPPAAKPPPSAPPAAKDKGPYYDLHLASVQSSDGREPSAKLNDAWSKLKRRYPDLLRDLEMRSIKVELAEKGIFFRLLAGSLPAGDATDTCDRVKATGDWCALMPTPGVTTLANQ